MSTRAMAQQYSRTVGGGSGGGADLFGLGSKRRLKEYQGMSDIDKQKELEIEAVLQKYKIAAEQAAAEEHRKTQRQSDTDSILKTHGIIPNDSNIADYDAATKDILTKSAAALANAGLGKANSQAEFYNSPEGNKAVKTGEMGLSTMPAFQAARAGERILRPGETGQFYDPMNLDSALTLGRGSMDKVLSTRYGQQFNIKTGQMETVPTETQQNQISPGTFSNPAADAAAKAKMEAMYKSWNEAGITPNTDTPISMPDDRNESLSTPPLQTMPQSNPQQQWQQGDPLARLKLILGMFGSGGQ